MTEKNARKMAQQRAYQELTQLISGPDETIDLTEAALLIASAEYPDLDKSHYIAYLDMLAHRVQEKFTLLASDSGDIDNITSASTEPTAQSSQLPIEVNTLMALDALNTVLFEEEGFHGNREDYYSPGNSFLNIVLDKRQGIPITLSLLYAEVGKRVGLHIDGIGLPYHFIARCFVPETNSFIYIDAYEKGTLMNEQGCRDRIRQIAQRKIRIHPHWFKPFTHRHWLTRMLTNLKRIYINNDDHERALYICDLLLLFNPQNSDDQRDRGLLHLQLRHYSRAIKDLKRYNELAPDAEDRYEILNYIKMARQMLAMLN